MDKVHKMDIYSNKYPFLSPSVNKVMTKIEYLMYLNIYLPVCKIFFIYSKNITIPTDKDI